LPSQRFLNTSEENDMDATIEDSRSLWPRLGIAAVVLALVALGAVLYYSPLIAIRNMQQAIDRRDAAAVADYVDFPALRENLKNTFTAKLMAGDGSGKDSGMSAMVAAFGSLLIGKLVDAMITPEGLAEMMRGKPLGAAKAGALGKKETVPAASDKARPEMEQTWHYETWNRVVVSTKERGSTSPAAGLVLERQGLANWRLTGFRFPE
jgi:hypothetical protein